MTTNRLQRATFGIRFERAAFARRAWQRCTALGLVLLSLVQLAAAGEEQPAPDDGLLAASGRALLPDGSPAAGAVVWAVSGDLADGVAQVQTDQKGEFHLRHAFDWGTSVNARSADWRLQASLRVSRENAREMFARPVEIRLKPAREQVVSVTFQQKPVADAEVVAVEQLNGKVTARTDRNGQARLWLPVDVKLRSFVAFHPSFGVGGRYMDGSSPPPGRGPLQLEIQPTQAHKIRVTDAQGKPVRDLELAITCMATDWVTAQEIEGTHVRTDSRGEALVRWMPKGAKYVNVSLTDPRWKLDRSETEKGQTAVTVLRKYPVSGQLVVPSGVDAEGILVVGNGSGPMVGMGPIYADPPTTRAGRDGRFTLMVAPNHGYSVEIVDSAWSCPAWTGLLLADEKATPPEIRLSVQPATKFSIHVTRGPQHKPVAGAWIFMRPVRRFSWVDASGRHQNDGGGAAYGSSTDENGNVQFAVGQGKWDVSMMSGKWREERKVDVTGGRPVSVDFDRPRNDKRTIAGRLTSHGKPLPGGPATVVRAWSPKQPDISGKGTVGPDGRFTVDIDADDAYVYAADSRERLSAARSAGAGDSTLDLDLLPMGTASGVVVDQKGRPLAGRAVELLFKEPGFMDMIVIESTATDEQGRFKFDTVPSQVPVAVCSGEPASERTPALTHRSNDFKIDAFDRFSLETGENRQDIRLAAEPPSTTESAAPRAASVPLDARLKQLTRDARLAGMRVLIILQGDSSKSVGRLSTQIVDNEDLPDVLHYLPLTVGPEDLKREAGLVARHGWERPNPGEIELVVLGGTGARLAESRIEVRDAAAARSQVAQFLRQSLPPRRDARAALLAARDEARDTGRRLVIVEGGPRCGGCFRLARWMDDQHALLSKDYVIVKVLDGVDENAKEVIGKLNPPREAGIPWFAITEPDGKTLATSDGPVGNTGFPSGTEEKKHFKQMLDQTARHLTPAERERLLESLGGD